ncbi:MAG: hypothetical protein NTW93_09810 [Phycisphaerae bacterium]|nr:hypothetical protein [Phycisphaerae bacterium]
MKKETTLKILFMLVLLTITTIAGAETIWETFDTNPSDWEVEEVGAPTGSTITYNAGGYIDARMARGGSTDYIRYHKHLAADYNQTQEFWFEYDFQLLGTGTITGDRRSQMGVFNAANNCNTNAVVDSFAYWSYTDPNETGDRGNRHDMYGWSPTGLARPSTATGNPLGNAKYDANGVLLVAGEPPNPPSTLLNRLPYDNIYRVKGHYYYDADSNQGKCSLKIYDVNVDGKSWDEPNTQTNPAADPNAVLVNETLDVNIFGLSSRTDAGASAAYALIRLDNFYFSTEGANTEYKRPEFPDLTVDINTVIAATTTTSMDVNTTISHTRTVTMNYIVRQRVYKGADGSGGEFTAYAPADEPISVPATTLVTVKQTKSSISPTPWSVRDPNCYQLRTEVLDSTGTYVLTSKSNIIGFRKFEVVGKNFKLNGNPIYLFGLHQTPPSRILANIYNNQSFIDQHIARLKSMNVNMVRIADANARAWFEACDKAGIMVFCGSYAGSGISDPTLGVQNLANLTNYVSKVSTHPSVVVWTTGNEWDLDDPNMSGQVAALRNGALALDSSRPILLAGSGEYYSNGDGNTIPAQTGSDFLDYHSYSGWYSGSAFDFTNYHTAEVNAVTLTECVGAYTNYDPNDGGLMVDTDKYIGNIERVIGHSYNYGQDSLAYQTFLAKEVAESLRRSRGTTSSMCGATPFTDAYFYDMDKYYYYNEPNQTETAKPVIAAITTAYEPVHVSIDCNIPNAFVGTDISATMHILNDNPAKNPLAATTLKVKLLDSASAVVKGPNSYSIGSIAYYAKATQAVSIPTTGLATGNYTIVAEVNEGATILSHNTMPVFIAASSFKTCANTGGTSVLALYDPNGSTHLALDAAGVTFTQINNFATLASYSRLIIGKDSFDANAKAADATIKTWLNTGKRMLILEQNAAGRTAFGSSWLGVNVSLDASSEDFTNIERPEITTLVSGLSRINDFRNWNDLGLGSKRSVYTSYVDIPSITDVNNALTVAVLANGGQHLEDATVVEIWPAGGGSCIISTLDGVTKVSDPKAAKHLANVVGYLLESATHYQNVNIGYEIVFGDFATEKGLFFAPLLQGMFVADSGAAFYRPDGRDFRGPQTISDTIGNLTAAVADLNCPLYFRAKFNIGGSTSDPNKMITVEVSNPNDVDTFSYRLIVNGTALSNKSVLPNATNTDTFAIASAIPAGTNVKLVIRAENKGLVFHSMKLGNALPTDFNKDGMVNLLDFAILKFRREPPSCRLTFFKGVQIL